MGFFEGLPAPKGIPGAPFLFQNFCFLDISNQQVNLKEIYCEVYFSGITYMLRVHSREIFLLHPAEKVIHVCNRLELLDISV